MRNGAALAGHTAKRAAAVGGVETISVLSGSTEIKDGAASPASHVQISREARVALAEATDNKKAIGTGATETRDTFDRQYKESGASIDRPVVSQLSGRAFAAVIVGEGRTFSRAEVSPAKKEVSDRARVKS